VETWNHIDGQFLRGGISKVGFVTSLTLKFKVMLSVSFNYTA